MDPITEMSKRISMMLVDAHPSIKTAYFFTQDSISDITRPCWLVFPEDTSVEKVSEGQDRATTNFSLAYIGQPYTSANYTYSTPEYEALAREVAFETLEYFSANSKLQMSDTRGLQGGSLRGYNGVLSTALGSLSEITLFQTEGVNSEIFWGFTLSISATYQLIYEPAI